jgi:hypothetical protein
MLAGLCQLHTHTCNLPQGLQPLPPQHATSWHQPTHGCRHACNKTHQTAVDTQHTQGEQQGGHPGRNTLYKLGIPQRDHCHPFPVSSPVLDKGRVQASTALPDIAAYPHSSA